MEKREGYVTRFAKVGRGKRAGVEVSGGINKKGEDVCIIYENFQDTLRKWEKLVGGVERD